LRIVKIDNQIEAVEILKKIDVDPYGVAAMAPKTRQLNVMLTGQPCRTANILKQEMLSLGADAAVARGSVACSIDRTDVLLMGTLKQLRALPDKIKKQPFGLDVIAQELQTLLGNIEPNRRIFKTSRREIVLGEKTLIMGVLNITPDSFSDGNLYFETDRAIEHALRMQQEGADIIDIGAASSRPGAEPVTAAEEIDRLLPVLDGLQDSLSVPVSVDTTKAQVAKASLSAGAEIVNDISALNNDGEMAAIVAAAGAGLILMHMRGTPRTMQTGDLVYADLMGEIIDYLKSSLEKARLAGIEAKRIAVDPGIGFGKTFADNCKIIGRLCELKTLGLPLLIGTSRKAFIGAVTDSAPDGRLEGTAATVAASIYGGCDIVRVHDVAVMKKVAVMTDAIVRS